MARLRKQPEPVVTQLRARGVLLADAPSSTPDAPPPADGETPATPTEIPKQKWIQVATSGVYAGHGEEEFTLDKGVFDKFVANLRSDPRFKAGADGVGSQPVVPFDYEHVSEMDPREGSVPAGGVPSPAWALDFKVEGDATASSLWAFVEFGENVRKQIAANEYRFVSIAFTLEATDPNTNADIGPLITSIAFTNHPFLRDLQPLAASARRAAPGETRGMRKLGWYYGESAKSPEQGFEYTRSILNLPASTTTDEVLAEVAKVIAWAGAPETAPAGVDIDDLMCSLRSCWTVPVTWSAQQVLEEIQKAAAALTPAAQTTPPTPEPAATPAIGATSNQPAAVAPPAPALSNTELTAMEPKKFVALLTKHSKTRTLDAGDAAAVDAAVESAVVDQGLLATILEALGVKDATAALATITELSGLRPKLAEALAQLDTVLAMQAQVDAATETQDVAAAMSANGLDPKNAALFKTFSVQRTHSINEMLRAVPKEKEKDPKTLADARAEGRKGFLSSHGVAEATRQHLLTNIVAGPNNTQFEAPVTAPGGKQPTQLRNNSTAKQISLAGYNGPNPFAKLCAYVQATEKGANGQPLSWDQVTKRASALNNDSTVAIVDAE